MIKGVRLKNFQEIDGHGDSRTFTAQIVMDGQEIGSSENDGWGGPNSYYFSDDEQREEFQRRVDEWAEETGETFESMDMFIEALIFEREKKRAKANNKRKGFPITILAKRGKRTMDLNGKDFEYFTEQWFVGVKDKAYVKKYVKDNNVEEHELL